MNCLCACGLCSSCNKNPINTCLLIHLCYVSKNLTNHALNKFIYPLFVVYYKSGYISFKNKFANITLSDLCYELYAYLFIVLIAIIYFPLKDELMSIYHNDDIYLF